MAEQATTRQQKRAIERAASAAQTATQKAHRIIARRANLKSRKAAKPIVKLTHTQRLRNTRGSAAKEANIRTRIIGPKHERNRSVLNEVTIGGVEFSYHATKGFRRVNVPRGVDMVSVSPMPPVVFHNDKTGHLARAATKRARKNAARAARFHGAA